MVRLLAIFVSLNSAQACLAAELPARFVGAWDDVTVTARAIDAGAWHCDVMSVDRSPERASVVLVGLNCDMRGGHRWKDHQAWSVETIGGKQVLLTGNLKTINVYVRQ